MSAGNVEGTPAVIYAAKSTEDKRGSIPSQLVDCRAVAARQGWVVEGEFHDEGFSAYKGNRGPGFDAAKRRALEVAASRGACVLIAQDADRFARGAGDRPGAADHVGEIYFRMKRGRVELWTCRDGHLDALRAVLEGERATSESARKVQSVGSGMARRKAAGKPVGPIPYGFDVDRRIVDAPRTIDPVTSVVVRRIFDMVESGRSFGEVARGLNSEGVPTKRSTRWSARTVRDLVLNRAYAGEKGYDAVIDAERYDRIIDALVRLDPSAVQRRKGGRPPIDPTFYLRGVVFCRDCGRAMWTRTYPKSGRRVYLCPHTRSGSGGCSAKPIQAAHLEGHVLSHLKAFVGDAETWLREQVGDADGQQDIRRADVQRQRDSVGGLANRLRNAQKAVDDALDRGDDGLATVALRQVARIEQDHGAALKALGHAEAVLEEWDSSGVDDALDYYGEVVGMVEHLQSAEGAAALGRLFPQVVNGIWASSRSGRLHAEFELRTPERPMPGTLQQGRYLLQRADPVGPDARRITLPDADGETCGRPRSTVS